MSPDVTSPARVRPDEWFSRGVRRPYDPPTGRLLPGPAPTSPHVWELVVPGTDPATDRWITMLPGFPDGSYGYAQVDAALGATPDPRLYVEFLGHGDSDKPRRYPYSTAERADLVLAHWEAHRVTETYVVAFDYATLVVLELLARRLEGTVRLPRITGALLANGGLFTDAHSHPWQTTPFMQTRAGAMTELAKYSPAMFRSVLRMSRMYSPAYDLRREELDDWFAVMNRRDGMHVLHSDAAFVTGHKVQGERLDFGRLYRAYRDDIVFTVTGAEGDVLEGRQTIAARDRLAPEGLDVRFHPGGHLTTHEHPHLLADTIRELTSSVRGPGNSPTHLDASEGRHHDA
jgi:pimeloyl-ACP methyl ester carboxylesterase